MPGGSSFSVDVKELILSMPDQQLSGKRILQDLSADHGFTPSSWN
jgi:hypothetical protein